MQERERKDGEGTRLSEREVTTQRESERQLDEEKE